ncbi:MAG TPA: hypothetical protein VFS67_29745 [Polyangiaceae bacterium]|nr:hypothetical protein [Polyangiaceae bacterium]
MVRQFPRDQQVSGARMASFDSALGMWKAKNGAYYATKEEALNADSNTLDDGDFFLGSGGIDAAAPEARAPAADPRDAPNPNNPGGISDNELARRQTAIQSSGRATANTNAAYYDRTASQASSPEQQAAAAGSGNLGGAAGAYNAGNANSRAAYDYMHELGSSDPFLSARQTLNRIGERAGISHAGDVANPLDTFSVVSTPQQLIERQVARGTNPVSGLGTTLDDGRGMGGLPVGRRAEFSASRGATAAPAAAPGTAPSTSANPNAPASTGALEEAHDQSQNTDRETKNEDETLFQENLDQLRDLTGGNYAMSDEARAYQKEGLQMQRDLLEKLLGFDPNAYASSFADQALARQIAAGRSAGGGAAAQQAGMFAAMEQAPALYAEGQQQADALENQRLAQAEATINNFGQLGTSTRGQDEARQQFESQLQLSIGKTFSDAVQGKMQLNEEERQRMSQVYVDFAQLQSVYDKMSSDEQLAELDRQMQQQGLDQQWKMFKEQLKADGKIKPRDIVNGFFQLGGGAIGAAGTILAARAGRKT